MKKQFLSAVLALALTVGPAAALPEGAFSGAGSAITAEAASVSINSTDVTLYFLSPSYEDVLTMPSSLLTQFQLNVTGASKVKYSVGTGNASVKVSDTGLIEVDPDVTYWYSSGGGFSWGSSTPQEGQEPSSISYDIDEGTRSIIVNADGTNYTVNVTLIEYSNYWYKEQLKQYAKENIKDSMTDLEKLRAIAAYPASFDYDYHYQGGKSMLLYGGGDCWASTNLIVDLCEVLGIKAWGRNANKDGGAGSGHMNAVAELNGKLYILEAGYSGSAPRSYDVYEKSSSFSYTSVTGGVEIYQYDGDPDITELEIPSMIDGKKVVSVGEQCFWRSASIRDNLTSVKLPDTVTKIGDSAFFYCENLEYVYLPYALSTIGNNAFNSCPKLKSVDISELNPFFTCKDGVIYDKDFTKAVVGLAVSEVSLPSTVKVIGNQSFRDNSTLKTINVPASVEEIEEGAFYGSGLEEFNISGDNLKTIGQYAFARCYSLPSIRLGKAVESIDEGLTSTGSEGQHTNTVIRCYENSAAHKYATDNDLPFEFISENVLSGKIFEGADKKALENGIVTLRGPKTYIASVTGNTFSVETEPGTYTVTVGKTGYATRTYTVNVKGETAQDLQINRKGDLNGNGKIDASDLLTAKSHIKSINTLTGYDQTIADIDGNGSINAADLLKMKAHMKGVTPIWQ